MQSIEVVRITPCITNYHVYVGSLINFKYSSTGKSEFKVSKNRKNIYICQLISFAVSDTERLEFQIKDLNNYSPGANVILPLKKK